MASTDEIPPKLWTGYGLRVEVTDPAGETWEESLEQSYAVVGSSDDCSIVLQDAAVHPTCLMVFATEVGLIAMVLAPQSKKAGQLLVLESEQPVPLGKWTVRFRRTRSKDVASNSVEHSAAESTLHCLTWKSSVGRQYLQLRHEHPVLIGRKAPAHLLLSDSQLSSLHGCLFRSNNCVWAIDLFSRNGTWSGGHRALQHVLQPDKSVTMGQHRIHYTQLVPHGCTSSDSNTVHPNVNAQAKPSPNESDSSSHFDSAVAQQADLLSSLRHLQEQNECLRRQSQQESTKHREVIESQQAALRALEHQYRDASDQQVQQNAARLDAAQLEAAQVQADLLVQLEMLNDKIANLAKDRQRLDFTLTGREIELLRLHDELRSVKNEMSEQHQETDLLKEKLVTERRILETLELQLRGDDCDDQPLNEQPVDEDHCVGSPDFHAMLDEALEALPQLDDS